MNSPPYTRVGGNVTEVLRDLRSSSHFSTDVGAQ